MQKIEIAFNKGKTEVKVSGVKGKSCTDLTKDFEAELGNTTSDVKTKEYYEQPIRDSIRQR